MEALNTIPRVGKFSDITDTMNENFGLITDAVNQLENSMNMCVGIFTSSSSLPTTGVSNGSWAGVLVSGGFPCAVWTYNGSTWSDSGETWTPDSVDAVEAARDEAISDIETAAASLIITYTELT